MFTKKSQLPSEADTVVIGGGISGVSTAYHLAKQSKQKVILLEKTDLTSGSTWHAAGLITNYHPGVNIKELHWYSMNLYSQLEKETGQQIGFHQCGSLRLATSPIRMEEFKHQMSRQGWHSAPQCLFNLDQIKESCPLIDIEGANVLGGLYTPYDGHIDPYSLTQAIAKGARKHGVQIIQQTQVTGLSLNSKENGWTISTNKGDIKSTHVVNAAGFWAREVGKLAGQDLPLIPIHHQYLVTKTVPEVKALKKEFPVLRHLDGSFYLRQERDGLLIGPYESKETMKLSEDWVRDKVPPGFGKELFEPDLDRLGPHLEKAMELVPCFSRAEIQSVVNGPITYSPDVLPMVGPSDLPNMWLSVGYGYGIVHGGGCGKMLADWILNGEPHIDFMEIEPLRYGKWASLEYAIKKVRESYGMNNAVPFPHEDRLVGRSEHSRKSAIYEDCLEAGAFMGFHGGWEQPEWYTSRPGMKAEYKPTFHRPHYHDNVMREYETVKENVGLIDISPFAKYIVNGDQAKKYLDRIVCGTVPKSGRTSIAHVLTQKGKVYAEFTITGLDNGSYLVITGSGVELHDLRHLESIKRVENWDVNIENITESKAVLGIAGPKSGDLLSRVLSDGNSPSDWKFLDAKKCSIGGVDCLAIQISYTGELGWELYMDMSESKKVYDSLINKGLDIGLKHFGTHANNIFRLEKGFKMWGSEMNVDVTPIEAGLDMFVRWKKKTQFIGKEALLDQKNDLLKSKLVMLKVENSGAPIVKDPEGNCTIWSCNKVVGNTTSGCYSPELGQGLVFGYVNTFLSNPGTEVDVELMGQLRKATVLPEPPVETFANRIRKSSANN